MDNIVEWYDDKPMFPNMFEKYQHDLQQVASSYDNYMDALINLVNHQEEFEAIQCG